ncbi:hypothetical protein GUJ93_ZPchr0005g15802 [Zizania palustris]|uniref:Uncharacterized protein n=1 Tax=Zizania palustris TaxID=103762 RepID=A0A8J5T427_ZIZPA|nr:hypothetical protein GUJ93_ZPchr0005g15802 [Zizania palustris]
MPVATGSLLPHLPALNLGAPLRLAPIASAMAGVLARSLHLPVAKPARPPTSMARAPWTSPFAGFSSALLYVNVPFSSFVRSPLLPRGALAVASCFHARCGTRCVVNLW